MNSHIISKFSYNNLLYKNIGFFVSYSSFFLFYFKIINCAFRVRCKYTWLLRSRIFIWLYFFEYRAFHLSFKYNHLLASLIIFQQKNFCYKKKIDFAAFLEFIIFYTYTSIIKLSISDFAKIKRNMGILFFSLLSFW